eukprot:CAMPEP_0179154850 /NCGR_PEP_ID=MMETSP0796-20121207/75394_1 /TAXON_ID=73915 /ORGANISM="Pyrodinium bahamense, Strain pbaha01" /LENGTH=166 /DNA_ID=CAMNT_0020856277 /DNA_START=13 /DNA_END=509 /DNA_ORIENTATION=+
MWSACGFCGRSCGTLEEDLEERPPQEAPSWSQGFEVLHAFYGQGARTGALAPTAAVPAVPALAAAAVAEGPVEVEGETPVAPSVAEVPAEAEVETPVAPSKVAGPAEVPGFARQRCGDGGAAASAACGAAARPLRLLSPAVAHDERGARRQKLRAGPELDGSTARS